MTISPEIERLAAVKPAALLDSTPIVDLATEDAIRESILRTSTDPQPMPGSRAPSIRRWRLVTALVAASAAAVGVAAAAGVWAPSHHAGPAHRVPGSGPTAARHASTHTIRLAGYTMHLPAGFTRSTLSCQVNPIPPGDPETVLDSMRVAASGDGGCLEAFFAAGPSTLPADAVPVQVGSAQGYEDTASGAVRLYIEASGFKPGYLLLVATGISADQLVAIAATGFPPS